MYSKIRKDISVLIIFILNVQVFKQTHNTTALLTIKYKRKEFACVTLGQKSDMLTAKIKII